MVQASFSDWFTKPLDGREHIYSWPPMGFNGGHLTRPVMRPVEKIMLLVPFHTNFGTKPATTYIYVSYFTSLFHRNLGSQTFRASTPIALCRRPRQGL